MLLFLKKNFGKRKKGKTSTRAAVFDVTHMKKDDSFFNDDIVDKVVCV
jgi:hypothetical protein